MTISPNPNASPDAHDARALLDKADQLGTSLRGSVSGPFVLTLLGIGCVGSLALPSFWMARHMTPAEPGLIFYPMLLMLAWLGAFLAFGLRGVRGTKRGFGRFWAVAMGVWSVLWVASMWLPGQVGDPLALSVASSCVLLAWTVGCSFWELRR